MAYRSSKAGSRNRGRTGSKPSSKSASKEPAFAQSDFITPEEARRLTQGRTKPHPMECICTICNCGAHKCPPDRVQGRYNNLKSSYMDDFKGAYCEPSRPKRQQYVHKPRPFVGSTTNQEDFAYKGVPERRKPVLLKDNNLGNRGLRFEGTTTNQHDFPKWDNIKARPIMKPDGRANVVPDDRDFSSESHSHFNNKGHAVRRSRAPVHNQSANVPFEGITTNQADFKFWNSRPTESFQRQMQYRPRPEDRDFKTEGRDEYTNKKRDYCPSVHVAVTSKPNNGHVLVEPCGDRYCHVNHVHDWESQQDGVY
jgi:hypothetical protein